MDDLSYMLQAVNSILAVLDRLEKANSEDRDLQLTIGQLDYLQRIAVNIGIDEFVTETIGRAHRLMVEFERKTNNMCHDGYRAPSSKIHGKPGRPSYEICKEQLSFFVEQGFRVKDISFMLGVSSRTIERRMSDYGLNISGRHRAIILIFK